MFIKMSFPPTVFNLAGWIGLFLGIPVFFCNILKIIEFKSNKRLKSVFIKTIYVGLVLSVGSIFIKYTADIGAWVDGIFGFPFCFGYQEILGLGYEKVAPILFRVYVGNFVFWFLAPQVAFWLWLIYLKRCSSDPTTG